MPFTIEVGTRHFIEAQAIYFEVNMPFIIEVHAIFIEVLAIYVVVHAIYH